MKEKFIKKAIYIITIIILATLLVFLCKKAYENLLRKKTFESSTISFAEKNEKIIFSINKITFFSSCDSKNKTSSKTNFTIENLYAYTDIAIFINNNSEENTTENTLKKVKISNIRFIKEPIMGKANLYYKSIENFSKSEINEGNIINKELEFQITSEESDFSKPILFNNCANPITLSYINQNIITDYTMTDTQNPITYDGKLLKRCGISKENINASISFDIEIENNKNQKFKTSIYFDIPYKSEEKTIDDGNIILNKNTNFNFYRYE